MTEFDGVLPGQNLPPQTRDWKKIYSEDFTADEKEKIVSSLKTSIGLAGFQVEKVWVEVIEDGGSQITFSALGQQAPLEEKQMGSRYDHLDSINVPDYAP